MGAGLEIRRSDYTSVELRAVSGRCSDGAQVRRLLAVALVLDGCSRTEAGDVPVFVEIVQTGAGGWGCYAEALSRSRAGLTACLSA